jgi:hypothetical protein
MAELSHREQLIFNAVKQSGNTGLPTDRLINIIWPDPDKEPTWSNRVIWVTVWNANKKLVRFGLKIKAQLHGDRKYRIIKLPLPPRKRMRGRRLWAF